MNRGFVERGGSPGPSSQKATEEIEKEGRPKEESLEREIKDCASTSMLTKVAESFLLERV